MNILTKKAEVLICNYVTATLQKIQVASGTCRLNYRCQMNAVHDAITNDQDTIAMCVYIDNGTPIIHFLNIDKKGNYTDNTLGVWSRENEYYLVKEIGKDDFFKVNDIFKSYRKELKLKIPFYIRWFSDCDF